MANLKIKENLLRTDEDEPSFLEKMMKELDYENPEITREELINILEDYIKNELTKKFYLENPEMTNEMFISTLKDYIAGEG